MFLIFGWGRQTSSNLGVYLGHKCFQCGRTGYKSILRVNTWFTLFFIPVFPYDSETYAICNDCSYMESITNSELLEIMKESENLIESKNSLEVKSTTKVQIGNIITHIRVIHPALKALIIFLLFMSLIVITSSSSSKKSSGYDSKFVKSSSGYVDVTGWRATNLKTGQIPDDVDFDENYDKTFDFTLKVYAPQDYDMVYKLYNCNSRKYIRYGVIERKDTLVLEEIPSGKYVVEYTCGRDWRTKKENGKEKGAFFGDYKTGILKDTLEYNGMIYSSYNYEIGVEMRTDKTVRNKYK